MSHRTLSVVAERPTVAICAGKDCQKRSESAKIRKSLEGACDLIDLKCVGLCSGPVVVVDANGAKPAVYAKLRSKRRRKLITAVVSGDVRARRDLADRRVRKKKVVARVARQAERRLPAPACAA